MRHYVKDTQRNTVTYYIAPEGFDFSRLMAEVFKERDHFRHGLDRSEVTWKWTKRYYQILKRLMPATSIPLVSGSFFNDTQHGFIHGHTDLNLWYIGKSVRGVA